MGPVQLLRALPPLLLDDEPAERAPLRGGAAQGQGARAAVQGGRGAKGNDAGRGTVHIYLLLNHYTILMLAQEFQT